MEVKSLNILFSINGPLLSFGFHKQGLTDAIYKNLTINTFNGLKNVTIPGGPALNPPAPTPPEIWTFSLQQCCGAGAVNFTSWSWRPGQNWYPEQMDSFRMII